MPKYVVPEDQQEGLREAFQGLDTSADILSKLRKAGIPEAEAEVKNKELQRTLRRFADAFEVDLE